MNSTWQYGWLAQEGEDLKTRQKFPHLLYMRTMWEELSDGMSRPHSEVLGLVCVREPENVWQVYMPIHRGLYETTASLEAAKQIVEGYYKRHGHET